MRAVMPVMFGVDDSDSERRYRVPLTRASATAVAPDGARSGRAFWDVDGFCGCNPSRLICSGPSGQSVRRSKRRESFDAIVLRFDPRCDERSGRDAHGSAAVGLLRTDPRLARDGIVATPRSTHGCGRPSSYINLRERPDSMVTHGYEHFGVLVRSAEDLRQLWADLANQEENVQLEPLSTNDDGEETFRFRHLLPMAVEAQFSRHLLQAPLP